MTAPRRATSARRTKAEKASADSIPEPERTSRTPPASHETPAPPGDGSVFDGQYRIKLESFEGPLDLLLHLIQQHELDILNIPVSFITEKYLEYLKLMQVLSIEIASEYLVMAATLVHIKSKMLLPVEPSGQDDGMPQEEEEDPRAELVRRLLEYQKYKAAAAELAERGTLGRDVFPRGVEEAAPPGPAELAKVEVFSLLEAFERILKKAKVKIDHEVVFDRISITDRIVELTEKLQGRRAVRFEWLFLGASREARPTRFDLVITFLAMLEMARMKLLRVYQTGPLAPIYMGLVEETEELSDEDRALADRAADRRLEELPDVEPAGEEEAEEAEEPVEPANDSEIETEVAVDIDAGVSGETDAVELDSDAGVPTETADVAVDTDAGIPAEPAAVESDAGIPAEPAAVESDAGIPEIGDPETGSQETGSQETGSQETGSQETGNQESSVPEPGTEPAVPEEETGQRLDAGTESGSNEGQDALPTEPDEVTDDG